MPVELTLTQLLNLVGRLDDSSGQDTARERFRGFLKEKVLEVGTLRDYVEECLRNSGDQYSRALQDLVNHVGGFLGFDVQFGRYQGVPGEIGFDGLWHSPTSLYVVLEVKTTDVYAVKTSTLVGYIDALISEGKIANWQQALGLYVVGRTNPEVRQLENSIVAEGRTQQLRVISVDSLLTLADMVAAYDVKHEQVIEIVRPLRASIDPVVEVIAALIARPPDEEPSDTSTPDTGSETGYWVAPVKSDEKVTAEDVIRELVGKSHAYAIGERTPGRKQMRRGHWICFYATGTGVVAHARLKSEPTKKQHPALRNPNQYPWLLELESVSVYFDRPTVLDTRTRATLDAFKGREHRPWAWFVQSPRRITERDFRILTRQ